MYLGCLAVLGACAAGETRVEVSASGGVGQVGYIAPVLAQAKADFLGTSGIGGVGDGGGATPYQGDPALGVTVAAVRTRDLGAGSRLRVRAYGEFGEVTAFLPEGMDVLTDPMTIDIWALGVGGDVALGRSVPLRGGGRVDYAAGVGVARTAARVHLSSALIDLRSRDYLTTPYLLAQGQYWPRLGPGVAGEVRVYDLGQAEIRLGVMQAF